MQVVPKPTSHELSDHQKLASLKKQETKKLPLNPPQLIAGQRMSTLNSSKGVKPSKALSIQATHFIRNLKERLAERFVVE